MKIDPKFTMDCLFILLKEEIAKSKRETIESLKVYYKGKAHALIFALRMLRLDTKVKYFLDGYNVKSK